MAVHTHHQDQGAAHELPPLPHDAAGVEWHDTVSALQADQESVRSDDLTFGVETILQQVGHQVPPDLIHLSTRNGAPQGSGAIQVLSRTRDETG